jgi:hypothetical protein
MSYAQHVKHSRNHRKDKDRQPIIMTTGSGFWPSRAFLEEDYWPYVEQCERDGTTPMSGEAYYQSLLRR